MIYMLAGVGLGAIIGAAAGLLFAPKAGNELRDDLGEKFKELKGKSEEWIAEQRAKRAVDQAVDEVGA
jgi:gas vesicle protein